MLSYIWGDDYLAAIDFSLRAMPGWYRAERETENMIEKLNSVKDLEHYIKSSDEYIRRLAILRLKQFSAKEAVFTLKEVLDNNQESESNKYLAAWVLKSLSVKWNFDIFVSSMYLGKFNGTESYDELFRVTLDDEVPSIRFDFSTCPSHSAFKLEAAESLRSGDIQIKTGFDFRQWFPALGLGLLKKSGSIIAFIFRKRPAKPSHDYHSIYREVYKKPGFMASIKKGLFNMLYLLFFPLRFVFKHKLAVLFSLAALYVMFAFTDYGRAFTNKYTGVDLRDFQKKTVESLKSYSRYALYEFNKLTGIDEWKKNEGKKPDDSVMPASEADHRLYLVTAQKGLNIRESPDAASVKVGGDPLPCGSTVTYLKTENDPSGKPWYYIKSSDGRTGWVSARFLKEKKEG